ncbi:exodeoxyribonuclease V subunit beta [Mycobacterium sp. shizuoka-1]|uniref:exodeoxyribonuclease V subunit beta n=1 Tax=Mycobacterium sp. shizuoka-1 TaxID=2039281 RepID=UPI000C065512|nr:exodeoxyribonuclease V subunit beta [Mycobacterium sp. shizuoka-1]GAY13893.1 RecBCD enzyme subunit RecB [Mycobacterium sp. shizuoka-1]
MHEFDLLGPLPVERSTTVLEASAGTGKTFTLAGLVTRYVAEGRARLDQMLLITFSRAATQELRERVRNALQEALRAFDDPGLTAGNDLLAALTVGAEDELLDRRRRLRDALAGFDAATIATTHQFCHLVLKSLGVAGDTDSHVTLAESLDDVVTEIVDDLYLRHFGQERERPPITRGEALKLAREVVANPGTELRPLDPPPGSQPAVRVGFANDVLAELDRRKRRRGILSYDDLLSRLAEALADPDAPAAARMHQRWAVVMVDEFQDTDPVQWQVIERAFGGNSTLILIGDPKQAIYAFRGGDIFTYLHAAKTAGRRHTLGVNWRSDSALVDRLQVVLGGAELGNPDIKVLDVNAHHRGHRLAGAPHNDPFRLRVVSRESFGQRGTRTIRMDALRRHIAADLAADIAGLLASGATFDGATLAAHQIAVITESHADARACFDALVSAGVPAVYTGDTDVLKSQAADDWLSLLEAFDQLHRPGLVRAAATTMFFGKTAQDLADGGDELTDRIAETLRQWADHARAAGVAAVFEAAQLAGMGRRVLSWAGGERNMTDLAHVTQLLHEVTHRERLSLTALRDWLRTAREERGGAPERNRRLDSDAAAVEIMTVWVSKGLQFPIVYLPFTFNRHVRSEDLVRFHIEDRRCLHVGGDQSAELVTAQTLGRHEAAGEETRLTYVAMTRAQSQVVAWWAPSWDEPNGGLSRLLRGRRPGQTAVPDRCDPERIDDADAMALLRAWETAGGPVLEESIIAPATELTIPEHRQDLAARHFHRSIDTTWRRTSYSGLIRAAETTGVSSEPEVVALDDEVTDVAVTAPPAGPDLPSPMADLPTGAAFGSLVHAVLETADPSAADLADELRAQIERHCVWWPVDVPAPELAAALVPMHDTSLGPLADGLTLRQIPLGDRLCEMDFEFPLAGGDRPAGGPEIRLAELGRLLGELLPSDDSLAPYADRLTDAGLGSQPLRGYLSGSVDVVLRIPDDANGHRYLVVDYKTNWLGEGDRPLSAADYGRARMAEAMLHSDYPLQALLYSVVLHRFLRWRQPGYDPERHLGGVLYLFVRGMCGPDTPSSDGHPAGVFSWRPPAALVVAVSELLDGRRVAV